GTVLNPTGLSILAILAVEIPLAYFMNAKIGLTGIWIAYATTFVTILLFQMLYFRFSWRRHHITRLV
ncbi:hypothetical protein, partial [Escherichia coli]